MVPGTSDLLVILPEIFILFMACIVLISGLFLEFQKQFMYWLTHLALWGVSILLIFMPNTESIIVMSGHYIKDSMSDALKICICSTVSIILIYSKEYLIKQSLLNVEYLVLHLLGVLGMLIMTSAHSLLSAYLGIELLSLTLYTLVTSDNQSKVSAEAGLKYFVLGALASGIFLYGISIVYGCTGTVDLQIISNIINTNNHDNYLPIKLSLAFLIVGLAFKLGAVPFHMWLPDVYQGAPTSVVLYTSSAPKLAAFTLFIRIIAIGLNSMYSDWQPVLIALSILSIGIGNLLALAQSNIKRMLAYSSISHVGFLLLGISSATLAGYTASIFYLLVYILTILSTFGTILILSKSLEIENIKDLRGLSTQYPWLALILMLSMLSMAGIPFMVGFYAKFLIFKVLIEANLIWLVIVSIIFSVIGIFYYLRIIKFMYFDLVSQEFEQEKIYFPKTTKILLCINGLLIVALGLYPTSLINWCNKLT